MPFVTDKQTFDDLNLLGKFKTGSLFNLFHRVKTRGGELLLEELFRSPLDKAADINHRSSCIRYLQEIDVTLAIDRELTEIASQYLTEGRPASKLSSVLLCYRQKTQEVLYRSHAYHLHQRHIHALQEVLLSASTLLGQLQKKGRKDSPCQEMQDRLSAIVHAPGLRQLKAKFPYTVAQMADCHYLFLHRYRQELEELLRLLYQFDIYISVAQVAASKDLVYAVASDNDKEWALEVKNLRHPSLPGAVGNSVRFTREENMLFLTGANMAGKSTWMKTLGVSLYLAHMGFPVAADAMRFTVMEGIYTSINVPDDIRLGWSHFYAEVMRVKLVAKEVSSGKRVFVLFDELFKGTNVKDAYDATLAVTARLARYRSCAFVISTHIIEVGEALQETANIQFGYMPTVMEDSVPRYTYHLTPGITSDRQGMVIIGNERILEILS